MGHFMKVVTRTQILKPKEMLKYVSGCLDKALYFSSQKPFVDISTSLSVIMPEVLVILINTWP